MTISVKQLTANRKNAKKGGIKTDKGKAISRLNATRHGIFSNVLLANTEDKKELIQLRNKLIETFSPVGMMEEILTDRIAVCIWRLRRCAIANSAGMEDVEREILSNKHITAEQVELYSKIRVVTYGPTELLLRYETTIERQMYRAVQELDKLQLKRLKLKDNHAIPVMIDLE
jgi:hypothetical protein